jgi:hypothetical protein
MTASSITYFPVQKRLDKFRGSITKPGASKIKMMNKKIILLLLPVLLIIQSRGQDKPLVKGMKITKSVKIKKQGYMLDGNLKMDDGVVIIEGNNITNTVYKQNNTIILNPNNNFTKLK